MQEETIVWVGSVKYNRASPYNSWYIIGHSWPNLLHPAWHHVLVIFMSSRVYFQKIIFRACAFHLFNSVWITDLTWGLIALIYFPWTCWNWKNYLKTYCIKTGGGMSVSWWLYYIMYICKGSNTWICRKKIVWRIRELHCMMCCHIGKRLVEVHDQVHARVTTSQVHTQVCSVASRAHY